MAYCKTTSYEDMIAIAPQTLEGLVRDYIIQLRHERRLSPASVSLYLAAIIHFYEMNDVTIKWNKLTRSSRQNITTLLKINRIPVNRLKNC